MSKLFSTVITICTTLDCLKNSIELSVPPKLNLCEHDQKSTYNPKHNKDGEIIQSSLNEKVRSCAYQLWRGYAVALPPNTFRDIVDTDPDQCLFSNNRTGPRERESQPTPPFLHVKGSLKGGLCERREEFNEVRGEHWSDSSSPCSYLNTVLKSLFSTYNIWVERSFLISRQQK